MTREAMIRRVSLVTAVVLTLAAFVGAADAKTWIESDGYLPGNPMPLELYGTPVGSEGVLRIKLPDTFDASKTPLAVFWMAVDDIDAPEETQMFVNGHGPVELPKSVMGEGAQGHEGWIKLDPSWLKPGDNEVKFVFVDNLKGTTSGFTILEAVIAIPRPDGKTDRLPMIERCVYLNVPGVDQLAVYDSTLEPQAVALRRAEPSGWKPHVVLQGDGKGGWTCEPAEFRFFHTPYGKTLMPFGLAVMDNNEIIFLASWHNFRTNKVLVAFSKDNGSTWTDWLNIRTGHGRPMMLAALGDGKVTFTTGRRYFSNDYGRTWPERVAKPKMASGGGFGQEGMPLVDRDEKGNAVRIAETGYDISVVSGGKWDPSKPTPNAIRWSTDGGRTWIDESTPKEWFREETYQGKTYQRGVSEGSLVRAKNGWIVAALRTDMPPKFLRTHNDNFEGIGVSISKDDGKTWTKPDVIFAAGRMHPQLLLRPNGDIVMVYIVRQDVGDDLEFATYNRGCEAIVSHDNGLTWDKDRRYVLDAQQVLDGAAGMTTLACGHIASCLLDDGRILTAYGHYASKGAAMIRWKP